MVEREEVEHAGVVERAAPPFDERDQIRGLERTQTFTFGQRPIVVKVFEVVAAIELDRRLEITGDGEPLVVGGIED